MKHLTETISKDSIDLSGFELKDTLSTKIWDNDMHLNDNVRITLLQLAYDFIESAKLPVFHDVIITGSLANFNWNDEYSDIDLHIVTDFNEISDDPDIAKAYCDEKKSNWNTVHNKITVYGYPVELYVQDKDEPHKSTGVYSLMTDRWIIKPSIEKLPDSSNKEQVKDGVSAYCNMIDTLCETFERCSDDKDAVKEISAIADRLYDAIRQERKESLLTSSHPELTTGNIMFKSLRRNGYMKKLIDLRRDCFDALHSI